MPLAAAPLVNGLRYDWTSIEIRIAGQSLPNSLTKIDYSVEKDGRAHMYGKGPDPIAQTRGRNKPSCSFSIYKSDFNHLVSLLDQSLRVGEQFFDIVVSYNEKGEGSPITDQIIGCTMTKVGDAPEQGGDTVVVEVECLPTKIVYNGKEF